MTDLQISINQRVKNLIEKSGKTPTEVAKLLKVHRQQVTEWCTEGKSVGKKNIDRLLSVFPEVGYEYFYSDKLLQTNEPNLNYNNTMDLRTQNELLITLSENVRELKNRVKNLEERLSLIEQPSKKKVNAG